MGLFNFITDLFSSSGKDKSKKGKKAPAKKSKGKPSSLPSSSPKVPAKKKATKQSPSKNLGTQPHRQKPKKTQKSQRRYQPTPSMRKALGFSISLKGEDERAKKRQAIRIKVKGLTVLVKRLGKKYPVTGHQRHRPGIRL